MKRILLLFFVLFFTTYFANAQSRKISGQISDQLSKEALANVSVNVKGTTIGTTTDTSGNFTLTIPTENNVLTVSYIGYEQQEVSINDRSVIHIFLEAGSKALNEVVVTGYTTQQKKDITGSVAIVDMKALKSIPSGSAVQALQGQASGVNIIRSGVPGGSSNIFIRGISSFGDSQPLVLVDGVQTNLDNISPNDVESMQVLKDAGAAAIYGVRGSNGVIIVTTKKGKSSSPIVTYDSYFGFQLPLQGSVFNLLNSEDFARLAKQANPNTALFQNGLPDFLYRGPGGSGVAMAGDSVVDPSKYVLDPSNSSNNYLIQQVNKTGTDWFHEIFKSAPMQNHNLTVSGGTNRANFLVSLGYLDQQGTLIETFLKRYSARVNSSYNVKKNIVLDRMPIFFISKIKI